MEYILRKSMQHRGLVLAAAVLLVAVGVYRATRLPVDVFPDISAPRVTIVTEAGGLAAEELELLVTYPIETAVNGVAGVTRIRSASAPGISLVWVEFDWDTEPAVARQRVNERLQTLAGALPPNVSSPILAPDSSVMGEIAFVALTAKTGDAMHLRRVAQTDVKRRLVGLAGISQVVVTGGEEKQIHVHPNPVALATFGLQASDLVAAIGSGNLNTPGGYLVEGGQESVVRIIGKTNAISDIRALVVTIVNGVPITLGQLAEVRLGAAPTRGLASYNGQPAVMLSVVKQPTADTVATTASLDAALAELKPSLQAQGIDLHQDIFRQQDFIDTAVTNVSHVLRDGAMLVVIVLLLFLWSIRPTIISLLAIPISLGTAILAMHLLGLSIDTMTLGGMAIAIGELVDDAIVDVENVLRRLRERAALSPEARPTVVATVIQGSLEIRESIVSATYIIMLVFLPLLLLDGLEGRLLRPLAMAYLIAIFASLIVAVTVTPVLCSLLLRKTDTTQPSAHREPPVMQWLLRRYRPLLRMAMKSPRVIAGAAASLVLLGVLGLAGLNRAFLPEFNEGSLNISMVLPAGTSLPQSDALATMAERALMADPGVLSVGRRTGRAEKDEHVLGVETSELEVRLRRDDPRAKAEIFADIRERLTAVPGQFTLGQPISHRIEHMISGQRSALAIKIFADDLADLRSMGEQVKELAEQVPGLVDVSLEQMVEIPQTTVRVEPSMAAAYGFSSGAAASAASTSLWGTVASHVYEAGAMVAIVVKAPAAQVSTFEGMKRLLLNTPFGAVAPLGALAHVAQDSGPNYVLRENAKRRIIVAANLSEGDARGALTALRAAIAGAGIMKPGAYIEYAGQFEREAATSRRLMLFGSLALLGIIAIVWRTLRSWRRTLIVLVNLPLALAGGVVGAYLAGGALSIATTIGFIALFGISMRNGILLVTRVRELELAGLAPGDAVAGAAQERLAPILMTAITAALGLLPLALAIGQPGSEIQAPMAWVILTGLATSTLLNMIVVPALLMRWGQQRVHPSADSTRR